jgi:uncharacterized protein (DUF885 family)
VAAQDPVNIVNFVNFGLSAGAAWGSTNDMRPINALKDGLMPLAMLEQRVDKRIAERLRTAA